MSPAAQERRGEAVALPDVRSRSDAPPDTKGLLDRGCPDGSSN
jgi:hypothetical protein